MKLKKFNLLLFSILMIFPLSSCTKDDAQNSSTSSILSTNSTSVDSSEIERDSSSAMSEIEVGDYKLIYNSELRTSVINDVTYIYFTEDNFVMADCDLTDVYSNADLTEDIATTYFSNNLASLSKGNYNNAKVVSKAEQISLGSQPGYQSLFYTEHLGTPTYVDSIVFLNNGHFSTITMMCSQNDYEQLKPEFEKMLSSIS